MSTANMALPALQEDQQIEGFNLQISEYQREYIYAALNKIEKALIDKVKAAGFDLNALGFKSASIVDESLFRQLRAVMGQENIISTPEEIAKDPKNYAHLMRGLKRYVLHMQAFLKAGYLILTEKLKKFQGVSQDSLSNVELAINQYWSELQKLYQTCAALKPKNLGRAISPLAAVRVEPVSPQPAAATAAAAESSPSPSTRLLAEAKGSPSSYDSSIFDDCFLPDLFWTPNDCGGIFGALDAMNGRDPNIFLLFYSNSYAQNYYTVEAVRGLVYLTDQMAKQIIRHAPGAVQAVAGQAENFARFGMHAGGQLGHVVIDIGGQAAQGIAHGAAAAARGAVDLGKQGVHAIAKEGGVIAKGVAGLGDHAFHAVAKGGAEAAGAVAHFGEHAAHAVAHGGAELGQHLASFGKGLAGAGESVGHELLSFGQHAIGCCEGCCSGVGHVLGNAIEACSCPHCGSCGDCRCGCSEDGCKICGGGGLLVLGGGAAAGGGAGGGGGGDHNSTVCLGDYCDQPTAGGLLSGNAQDPNALQKISPRFPGNTPLIPSAVKWSLFVAYWSIIGPNVLCKMGRSVNDIIGNHNQRDAITKLSSLGVSGTALGIGAYALFGPMSMVNAALFGAWAGYTGAEIYCNRKNKEYFRTERPDLFVPTCQQLTEMNLGDIDTVGRVFNSLNSLHDEGVLYKNAESSWGKRFIEFLWQQSLWNSGPFQESTKLVEAACRAAERGDLTLTEQQDGRIVINPVCRFYIEELQERCKLTNAELFANVFAEVFNARKAALNAAPVAAHGVRREEEKDDGYNSPV